MRNLWISLFLLAACQSEEYTHVPVTIYVSKADADRETEPDMMNSRDGGADSAPPCNSVPKPDMTGCGLPNQPCCGHLEEGYCLAGSYCSLFEGHCVEVEHVFR